MLLYGHDGKPLWVAVNAPEEVLIDHALSSADGVLAAIADGVLSDRAATTSAGATVPLEAHLRIVSGLLDMAELRLFVESVDTALRWVADAVRTGRRPAAGFPDLREAYRRAAQMAHENGDEDLDFVMQEADSITNTVNTLAHLLVQPNESSAYPPRPEDHHLATLI